MKIKFIPFKENTSIVTDAPLASRKLIPEWYKKIPPLFPNEQKIRIIPNRVAVNSTVKKCVPFLEAMLAGYTYVLADDIIVEILEDGSPFLRWRTKTEIITDHSPDQFGGIEIGEEYHNFVFKWANEWSIETAKNYSLWVTHPANRYDLPFSTFTGFVETDGYGMPIQFPFLLKKNFQGVIEKGTPVAQFIPIKRENWKSEIAKYDQNYSLRAERKLFGKIINSYKNQFWVKKTYE
jgi:hypothetical protein